MSKKKHGIRVNLYLGRKTVAKLHRKHNMSGYVCELVDTRHKEVKRSLSHLSDRGIGVSAIWELYLRIQDDMAHKYDRQYFQWLRSKAKTIDDDLSRQWLKMISSDPCLAYSFHVVTRELMYRRDLIGEYMVVPIILCAQEGEEGNGMAEKV